MRAFMIVLRVIFTLPALILGLALRFLSLVFGLAAQTLQKGMILGGYLLASLTTSVLVIALLAAAIGADGIGFIRSYWYLWLILYAVAGLMYVLAYALDYITVGIQFAGDHVLMIPPWS